MRIALTHNLRLSDAEEEAEFDTEETVNALASAIERLGHRVEKMEVSGPASRTVARLEAFSPDLIFNTAEGRRRLARSPMRILRGAPTKLWSSIPSRITCLNKPFGLRARAMPLYSRTAHSIPSTPRTR